MTGERQNFRSHLRSDLRRQQQRREKRRVEQHMAHWETSAAADSLSPLRRFVAVSPPPVIPMSASPLSSTGASTSTFLAHWASSAAEGHLSPLLPRPQPAKMRAMAAGQVATHRRAQYHDAGAGLSSSGGNNMEAPARAQASVLPSSSSPPPGPPIASVRRIPLPSQASPSQEQRSCTHNASGPKRSASSRLLALARTARASGKKLSLQHLQATRATVPSAVRRPPARRRSSLLAKINETKTEFHASQKQNSLEMNPSTEHGSTTDLSNEDREAQTGARQQLLDHVRLHAPRHEKLLDELMANFKGRYKELCALIDRDATGIAVTRALDALAEKHEQQQRQQRQQQQISTGSEEDHIIDDTTSSNDGSSSSGERNRHTQKQRSRHVARSCPRRDVPSPPPGPPPTHRQARFSPPSPPLLAPSKPASSMNAHEVQMQSQLKTNTGSACGAPAALQMNGKEQLRRLQLWHSWTGEHEQQRSVRRKERKRIQQNHDSHRHEQAQIPTPSQQRSHCATQADKQRNQIGHRSKRVSNRPPPPRDPAPLPPSPAILNIDSTTHPMQQQAQSQSLSPRANTELRQMHSQPPEQMPSPTAIAQYKASEQPRGLSWPKDTPADSVHEISVVVPAMQGWLYKQCGNCPKKTSGGVRELARGAARALSFSGSRTRWVKRWCRLEAVPAPLLDGVFRVAYEYCLVYYASAQADAAEAVQAATLRRNSGATNVHVHAHSSTNWRSRIRGCVLLRGGSVVFMDRLDTYDDDTTASGFVFDVLGVPNEGIDIGAGDDAKKDKHSVEDVLPRRGTLRLCAPTAADRDAWAKALRAASQHAVSASTKTTANTAPFSHETAAETAEHTTLCEQDVRESQVYSTVSDESSSSALTSISRASQQNHGSMASNLEVTPSVAWKVEQTTKCQKLCTTPEQSQTHDNVTLEQELKLEPRQRHSQLPTVATSQDDTMAWVQAGIAAGVAAVAKRSNMATLMHQHPSQPVQTPDSSSSVGDVALTDSASEACDGAATTSQSSGSACDVADDGLSGTDTNAESTIDPLEQSSNGWITQDSTLQLETAISAARQRRIASEESVMATRAQAVRAQRDLELELGGELLGLRRERLRARERAAAVTAAAVRVEVEATVRSLGRDGWIAEHVLTAAKEEGDAALEALPVLLRQKRALRAARRAIAESCVEQTPQVREK